jgi:hypothetical protein
MNHHSARWRRRAKNRSDHKTGYPRVHLGRADFDLVHENAFLVSSDPAACQCEV